MNIQFSTFPQVIQDVLHTIPPDRHFLALAVLCPEELYYTFTINAGETNMNVGYQAIPAPGNIITEKPTQGQING